MKTNLQVLLVDDDKINNYINVSLLKKLKVPCDISISRNGADAIRHIKANQLSTPDFIFLDIEMPIMNGMEFLEEFSKTNLPNKENTKVIILSATLNSRYMDTLDQYQIHSYLNKPLTEEKVWEVLESSFYCSEKN